jgi:protein-tyrosine phosphatase
MSPMPRGRTESIHFEMNMDNLGMFSVEFVCTGNICRSPAAERMFLVRLPWGADIQARSAGTSALVGSAIDSKFAGVLNEAGIDAGGHVARQLDLRRTKRADLVLCAAMEHRGAVLREAPGMIRKTFTVLEFARLAESVPEGTRPATPRRATDDELRAVVRRVAAQRGRADVVPSEWDDIADPYGAGDEAMRRCVAQLSAALDNIVGALGIAGPATAT